MSLPNFPASQGVMAERLPIPSGYSPPTSSSFLRSLGHALGSAMHAERALTIEVGVMSAGGLTRAEIVRNVQQRHPDLEETDIKMAMLRLKRVAESWRAP